MKNLIPSVWPAVVAGGFARIAGPTLAGLLGACTADSFPRSPGPPLFEAVDKGDLGAIKAMVAKGEKVDARTEGGFSALCAASADGNREIAAWLIARGAKVDGPSFQGGTPLYYAVGKDDAAMVRLLLDKGANPETPTNEGRPLCVVHSAETAAILLARGARVNAAGDRNSPLHGAVYRSNVAVTRVLLAHGADCNALNGWGVRPLHEAVRSEKPSVEIVNLLIDHGAKVNAASQGGDTPLHVAGMAVEDCMSPFVPFAIKSRIMHDRLQVARVLLAHGADVNARNHGEQTPLAAARQERNYTAVMFFATHGGST